MQGNRPAGVLLLLRLLLTVLLLVPFAAPPAAAATAYSGRVFTSHAATGTRASAHLDAPAFTRTMEDEIAPEMMNWAANLASGGINYDSLNPNRQACRQNCAGHGGPYTGHGCKKIYQNRGC
ncbi:hypothetical protein ACUV84_036562 [Puccinellia chinampoensis]